MTEEIFTPTPAVKKDGTMLRPKPLTREGYTRRRHVEECITNAMALDADAFRTQIQQADEKRAGYFPPEALVYFIRRAVKLERKQTVNLVTRELLGRCKHFFRKNVREFLEKDREDVLQEIMEEMIREFSNSSDEADFAEHSFWSYLKRKTIDVCDRHRRKLGKTSLTLDAGWEKVSEQKSLTPLDYFEDERALPDEALASKEEWIENRKKINAALMQLPPKLRRVYVLSRGLDAKSKSKRENEMTLSRFFGVSDRAIRNWLKEADQILSSFLEN